MPRELLTMQSGAWQEVQGTDITVDNCLRSRVRDLRIEGKTIQDPEDLSNIESVTEKENNILSVKINDNVTTLNLPIPLRSLPNGVCDTIEGNKLIQRVGKYTYNGDETIESERIGELIRFKIIIKDYKPKLEPIRRPILSDKFTTTTDAQNYEGLSFSYNGRIYIYPQQETIKTVDSCKQWLVENKPTFYYELETPIVHDLTIPSIYTEKGTNIITTENNIKPKLSMKVKVKK